LSGYADVKIAMKTSSKASWINIIRFMGKWLIVKKAKDPDIILWENLNKSQSTKYFRYSISILLCSALTFLTMIIILSLSYYENLLE
jgi:hypothetical protein